MASDQRIYVKSSKVIVSSRATQPPLSSYAWLPTCSNVSGPKERSCFGIDSIEGLSLSLSSCPAAQVFVFSFFFFEMSSYKFKEVSNWEMSFSM